MNDFPSDFKLTAGGKGLPVRSKKIILTQTHDNEFVVYTVREMAKEAGFKTTEQFTIAAAASELATNILRFAGTGEMDVGIVRDTEKGVLGIELFASDAGPGIGNLELAMQEHYSTMKNSLGLGLPSVKRIMGEFFIESIRGRGTRVIARKWRENERD